MKENKNKWLLYVFDMYKFLLMNSSIN